jgi:hypothetical protein
MTGLGDGSLASIGANFLGGGLGLDCGMGATSSSGIGSERDECPFSAVSGEEGYRYLEDWKLPGEDRGLGGLSMPVLSDAGARRSRWTSMMGAKRGSLSY